jgi:hypothetical protein
MSYAAAVEVMRGESQVGRVIEVHDEESVLGVEGVLKGED